MKRGLIALALAVLALGGCVAVPVYDGGPGYGYYGPPAATFNFGYSYHDGGHRYGHRHGHRHRGHRY